MRLGLLPAMALLCAPAWAQPACQRALELHQAGDLGPAVDLYRQCLENEPNRYEVRSNLGAVLAALGRFPEAVEQYRQALAAAPPQFAARLKQNLALAFYKSGQFAQAIATLLEVRPMAGGELKTDLLLADSYLQNGEPAKAAEVLSPYEAGQSDDRAVAYVLGTALVRSGQVALGQKVIDRILRDGDSAEARFLVGVTAYSAGDYPGAVQQLAGALALNAKLPSLHSYYGQALLATGDADGASEAFRQELALNPNDFDSNLHLGEILKQRKSFDQAQVLFEKAVEARPQAFAARAVLASLELERGHYRRAAEMLETLTRQWPDAPAPHRQLAQAYTALGRKTEAAGQERIAAKLGAGVQVPDQSGPRPGEAAPEFSLPRLGAESKVSLRAFRGGKAVALLFGSYTCPNFRQQAPVLKALAERYGSRVPFLLVYIREAHGGDSWQSTINQRQGIDWAPARSQPEMQEHASSCIRKLKMNFPAVVDELDGQVESQYAAWPSRFYVIGSDGRVLYRTRLSELDFQPAEIEAAIRSAASQ